jgi:hypothetical protein
MEIDEKKEPETEQKEKLCKAITTGRNQPCWKKAVIGSFCTIHFKSMQRKNGFKKITARI